MANNAGKPSGSQPSEGNNNEFFSGSNGSLQTGPSAPRPMRLKILYSLDELMPNCLARAKEVAQVRVIQLDTDTAIGLVDLRTCVLNITYSSPEILHHHGCDYSVYAFDYSEPDTPIVGLGLLSWVLSLPALNGTLPDPDAIPLSQATRIVTGRVQKNLIGLFAGGVKETLEVRMRLCRVPALKQAEYVNQMNQYSSMSKSMPAGMDVASWWTQSQIQSMGYPQQTYMPGQDASRGYVTGPAALGPPNTQPIPPGQPLGPPATYPSQQQYALSHPAPPYYGQPQYLPPPPPPPPSDSANYIHPPPAPSSTLSVPPNPPQPTAAPTSGSIQSLERDDSLSDAAQPAKKKQKLDKSDKSGLPSKKRGPGRPRKQSENTLMSSEPGIVPQLNRTTSEPINTRPPPSISLPHTKSSTSSLATQAPQNQTDQNSIPQPQFVESQLDFTIDTNTTTIKFQNEMLSPAVSVPVIEGDTSYTPGSPGSALNRPTSTMIKDSPYLSPSADPANTNTPANTDLDSLFIGSSPPISSGLRSDGNPTDPTSPFLPESPGDSYSPDDDARDPSEALREPVSREPSPATEDQLPPMQSALSLPSKPTVSFDVNVDNDPTSSMIKGEDSVKDKNQDLKAALTSDAATQPDVPDEVEVTAPAPKRRRRGGDDYQRCTTTKERIERKMKEKIKAGEIPPYCTHCGQIETPTWRKVKIPIEDPEEGEPTEREILLCNPCGLWHHNHGTMRPEQFWDHPENKPKPTRKPRRKKSDGPKSTGAPTSSADNGDSNKVVRATEIEKTLNSGEGFEKEGSKEAESKSTDMDVGLTIDNEENDLVAPLGQTDPSTKARATTPTEISAKNEEWVEAIKSKTRRIQSSPPPLRGTVADPICLLTPERSINRVLFPGAKPSPIISARLRKSLNNSVNRESDNGPGEQAVDKENHPPKYEDDDLDWEAELEKELMDVVSSEEGESHEENKECPPIPSTPNKTPRPAQEYKTPIRRTPNKSLPGSMGKSPWRALFGSVTPSGRWPTFDTPNAKLLGTPSQLMSPASGEIMLELLQEMNRSNPTRTSPSKLREQQDGMTTSLFNDLDLDFNMPDHDFLAASDQPMPSSPPPMFRLYDEGSNAVQSSSSLWSDVLPSSPNAMTYSLDFLNNMGSKQNTEMPNINLAEDALDLQLNDDLVVDFSEFIAGVTSTAKAEEVKDLCEQAQPVAAKVVAAAVVGTPTGSTTEEEGK